MDIRKAIIFDMDGTMFDTEPISYHCWRDVSARHGFDLDRSVFNRMLGRDNLRIRAICDDAFGPDYPYDDICREKVALQLEYYRSHAIPIKPGLLHVLHYAREEGIACAVASSSPRTLIEYLLDKTGVAPFFSVVQSGDEAWQAGSGCVPHGLRQSPCFTGPGISTGRFRKRYPGRLCCGNPIYLDSRFNYYSQRRTRLGLAVLPQPGRSARIAGERRFII